MKKLSHLIENVQHRLFQSVVSNNLVYNTCWEDPRIDRRLLQLDSNSKIVMLTSAGCNALDYLLDGTEQIHCVDTNPAQNALLELKKALFLNGDYSLLWNYFGEGNTPAAHRIYRQKLRRFLSPDARGYWDHHISNFAATSSQPSFYYSGTSGKFALMVYRRIQRKGLYSKVLRLLEAESLEEQTYYFEEVEPQLWNSFSKWLIRQHATMSMLGVPTTQQKMIKEEYHGGLLHFIRDSLRQVFTRLPVGDNYFWRVYLTGSYSRNCCPNYLRERHFESLHQRVDQIKPHTSTLLQFLKHNPGSYSHFVLLDHMDWMANARPRLLAEEWKHLLVNSRSGTRILFRSAGPSLNFLPDFVFDHVAFRPDETEVLHQKDRVGTYESTHLGVVQ